MAKKVMKTADATGMFQFSGEAEPLLHGGDVAAARRLFPGAPQPFIDLSTGINPHSYRLPRLSADLFERLPSSAATVELAAIAARAYGAPSAGHVVPAPGTQILLPLVAGLVRPGRAAVVSPAYGELARAAVLAGHKVDAVRDLAAADNARLVLVGNPNNPDGRTFGAADLIDLAKSLRARGGMLVVDEAFMDVGPPGASLAPQLNCGNVIVLRSFGKFFGLAGVRLGFALAAPPLAARIAAMLGPWAVSGPALAAGAKALTDKAWIDKICRRLAKSAARLDATLTAAGFVIVGGTSLFRLVRVSGASKLSRHLGRAGILVRMFPEHPQWVRFGLPANDDAWRRLEDALAEF
ncbi:MAG: threonine-phosphate decarboxylase CobD [Xanthobacteraceae bacterium]